MPRVAITGHRNLYDGTADRIRTELRNRLAALTAVGPVTGVSCLADGADAMFAEETLAVGGALVAVVPAVEYRDGLPSEHWPTYDRLLAAASDVIRLDHTASTEQSHMDASVTMLDGADHLIAVWDGRPAAGFGGTADVVDYANEHGITVDIVWPDGAKRGR